MQTNKTYDSLPGNSETFEVTFDYYTPRPHFIIATRDKEIKQYESLTDVQKEEVIKIANATFSEFKENTNCTNASAVLSQHCGTWYTETHNFHAHLCLNKELFEVIFTDKKGDWQNKPCDLEAELYISEAMSYPKRNFKEGELKKIHTLIGTELPVGAKNESPSTFTDICFHPSQPRVGFFVKDKPADSQKWLDVQKEIIVFASTYKLTNQNGCHVCLVLDDNTHGK